MELSKLIEQAKVWCISQCIDGNKRKWLEANLNSYSAHSNEVKVLVLEGSPPRGIIISNLPLHAVWAFNAQGKLRRFKFNWEQS